MPRRARFLFAPVVLALSAATASAQEIYPLTNGPDGTAPNVIDSARGFIGANAIAPEREFLYHPERAGDAYATYLAEMRQQRAAAAPEAAAPPRRARRDRRHRSRRR